MKELIEFILSLFSNKMTDVINIEDKEETFEISHPKLIKCYPPFAEVAERFIKSAKQWAKENEYDVDIHMALRTWEEQDALYAIGRTIRVEDKIVTKAKGGQSFHNYGLAIDVVFDGNLSKQGMQWSWDDKFPWAKIGEIGKSFGLEWAGDWKTFREMPHFQMSFGTKVSQLQEWYKIGGLKQVWEELDKIRNSQGVA